MILNLYKNKGETPLQCVERWRNSNPAHKNSPITYAGRLDPLAEGVMLVLTDNDVHKKEEYSALPKEYAFTLLLGVETDTYDTLGVITASNTVDFSFISKEKIEQFLRQKTGTVAQQYPPYSSKTVNGIPLWRYAREGQLHEIVIPEHTIQIFNTELKEISKIQRETLESEIMGNISRVTGDFRQEEITRSWRDFFEKNNQNFLTVAIIIQCGSGTYVRSIVHDIGRMLGTGATTLHICRTKIGNYSVQDSIRG
jgi:tRNA pseudouridine55 synthase